MLKGLYPLPLLLFLALIIIMQGWTYSGHISDLTIPMKSSYTVLIIDDTDEERILLKRYLKKTELPLVILEGSSGEEGVDILSTPIDKLMSTYPGFSLPVTLFLDINMPVMNGWEFIEELAGQGNDIQFKPSAVVMYSTFNSCRDQQLAECNSMVTTYLVKGKTTVESLKQTILQNRRPVAA